MGWCSGGEATASNWNFQKVCDLALKQAVDDIFELPAIRRYLEGEPGEEQVDSGR